MQKWAILSWEKPIKPKKSGGLGLRDPYILNQVMGAKLWWRWIQGGPDLWKEIWTLKYNMPTAAKKIMRKEVMPKGSMIWELAC